MHARRSILILAIVLTQSLASVGPCTADGSIFQRGEDWGAIHFVEENQQYAIIHHYDGMETMLIGVNLDWEGSNKTAWVLPIPAPPENISVQLCSVFPAFYGTDPLERGRELLDLECVDFLIFYGLRYFFLGAGFMSSGGGGGGGEVKVSSHIEAGGFVIEVVSSTDGQGLYGYLTGKGLAIAPGAVAQLDGYVASGSSFVVTWLTATDVTVLEPMLAIRFPAARPYFPLKLTSTYGDAVIPIELVITDHVRLSAATGANSKLAAELEMTVYEWGGIYPGTSHDPSRYIDKPFFNNTQAVIRTIEDEWPERYTRVRIRAPASSFTDDLVFEHGLSSKTEWKIDYIKQLSASYSPREGAWKFMFFFWVFSLSIALFGGMLGFGYDPRIVRVLVVFGICHAVSFLLYYIVVAAFMIDAKRFKKFTPLRRITFVFGFPALVFGVMLTGVVLPFVPLL